MFIQKSWSTEIAIEKRTNTVRRGSFKNLFEEIMSCFFKLTCPKKVSLRINFLLGFKLFRRFCYFIINLWTNWATRWSLFQLLWLKASLLEIKIVQTAVYLVKLVQITTSSSSSSSPSLSELDVIMVLGDFTVSSSGEPLLSNKGGSTSSKAKLSPQPITNKESVILFFHNATGDVCYKISRNPETRFVGLIATHLQPYWPGHQLLHCRKF